MRLAQPSDDFNKSMLMINPDRHPGAMRTRFLGEDREGIVVTPVRLTCIPTFTDGATEVVLGEAKRPRQVRFSQR